MDVQHHRLRKINGLTYSTVSVPYKTIHKKPLRMFAYVFCEGKSKYSVDMLSWAQAQIATPTRQMFPTRTKALSYCLQISERLNPDD